jgi:alpha-tubulin suppressor-like RCC1 family protein
VSGLTSGVSVVSAGSKHSCAVTDAGAVKCWGSNSYGQLGNGTTADSATPVAVTGLSDGVSALTAGWGHTCAVTAAGAIKCWGFNAYGQLGDGSVTQRSAPVGVVGWSGGSAGLAAGTYHTCAISAAGGAWCWGRDSHGQLGLGTITERLTPVDVVAALFAPYAHLPLTLK